jgi:L-iditol 2-dehydrogenase
MKTRAAFTYGQGNIQLSELDLPQIEPKGLVIRVEATGICGSDSRMYFTGLTPRYINPVVLGHEFSGRVFNIGKDQTEFNIGDLVTIAPIIPCMRCIPCLEGNDNLCEKAIVIGCNSHGAMAEYFYVPQHMVEVGGVVKVPTSVNAHTAAMSELVGTCLNGWQQTGIEPGDNVVIFGDGPIGLTFLQLARNLGAGWVGMVGHRDTRLKMATELGADDVRISTDQEITSDFGQRIDRIVIATSNISVLNESFGVIKDGGSILLFSGYLYGSTYSLDLNRLHYKQLHLHGAIDCTIKTFRQAVKLLPKLQMEKLISRSYSLDQVVSGFLATKEPSVNKIVIVP